MDRGEKSSVNIQGANTKTLSHRPDAVSGVIDLVEIEHPVINPIAKIKDTTKLNFFFKKFPSF